MKINLNWTDFKSNVDSRNLSINYFQKGNSFFLHSFDGKLQFECKLDVDESDYTDFITNYGSKSNKKSKSQEISGILNPNGMRARLVGIFKESIAKNGVRDLDWKIPQLGWSGAKDSYFDGIEYYAKDAELFDTMKFQVVDLDGAGVALGWYDQATFDYMGNYFLVEEFGENWNVIPNTHNTLKLYKAKLLKDFYIRIEYTSTGTTSDIPFVCNIFRHLDGNS